MTARGLRQAQPERISVCLAIVFKECLGGELFCLAFAGRVRFGFTDIVDAHPHGEARGMIGATAARYLILRHGALVGRRTFLQRAFGVFGFNPIT